MTQKPTEWPDLHPVVGDDGAVHPLMTDGTVCLSISLSTQGAVLELVLRTYLLDAPKGVPCPMGPVGGC